MPDERPDDQPVQPDAERREPRVRDDEDPGQGPPVEDDDVPAAGVLDPELPDAPEPNEPA